MSLKSYLLQRSKKHEGIIRYSDIEMWTLEAGIDLGRRYKVGTAERKMRELAQQGKLDRLEGKYANYRYKRDDLIAMQEERIRKEELKPLTLGI